MSKLPYPETKPLAFCELCHTLESGLFFLLSYADSDAIREQMQQAITHIEDLRMKALSDGF